MKTLWTWLVALDRTLRGETTRVADLRDGAIKIPLLGIAVVLILLAMLYGACMGCYALINTNRGMQMTASVVKVPALFLLTLIVTFPSLYVFNALVGSRLTVNSLARLFVAALGVNVAVLASLGPIVAFFAINTTSYSFIVLLNVVMFAVSGLLSLVFLLQTLQRLTIAWRLAPRPAEPIEGSAAESRPTAVIEAQAVEPGPLERVEGHVLGRRIKVVFTAWMIVFGLVGAQMSWVLRPFVGSPDLPFEWFRPRDSNFFEAVTRAIVALFG